MLKKLLTLLLSLLLLLASSGCSNNSDFSSWNDNDSLSFLIDYVKDVTDDKSEHYIPQEDRIAVFDMDGTLYSQTAPYYFETCVYIYRILKDPTYSPTDAQMQVARQIMTTKSEGDEDEFTKTFSDAFVGMSIEEFDKYIKDYINNVDAEDYTNLKYCDLFYKPMLEIIDYLNKNNFTVYICSGTDRYAIRAMATDHCNVESNHIIGADIKVKAENEESYEYTYTLEDKVIRTSEVITSNINADKVSQLAKEIGKRPVLSFGNSDGDISMNMYTLGNDKYETAAFMLVNDDDVREHGNPLTAKDIYDKWHDYGFYTFSIKDDFKEVFAK